MPEVTRETVYEALREIYDPEIPLNIVDLGLVYDAEMRPAGEKGAVAVSVRMTLTSMGCAMGPQIAESARQRILQIDGVEGANVEIVWDPPWSREMISEEGQVELGLI